MTLAGHIKWEEIEHPRGVHGKFAHKAFSEVKSKAGKGATPKSFKFYKQGYTPKPWSKITGNNVKHYGRQLYKAKQQGAFDSDYEFWLFAQKLHADAKKKHGSNAPTPHSIVNAAFHYEMVATSGPPTMLGDAGGATKVTPPKNVHDVTPGGVKTVSKFLAPGQLQPTGKKMPGVNGAMVYQDAKGNQWLVKFPGGSKGTSQAYSNSQFLVDLDVATSRIQNKAGLPVPSIHAKEVDGKIASVHKMYSRVSDAFPDNKPNLAHLEHSEVVEIQQNMVLDWLLSNHDPHSGNFLKTDKGIIGIDKGQSFKYFGKDKLTPQFGSDINPPLAPNVSVYSTIMKQHVDGQGHLLPFNEGKLKTTIDRIQAIPDDEYKGMLRPYAEKAAKVGLLNYPGKPWAAKPDVEKFLEAAVARKNNLATDFDNLWNELNPKPASLEELSPEGMKPSSVDVNDFLSKHPKMAPGYAIVQDGMSLKWKIKKPNGEFSKSSGGEIKTWDTPNDALDSSTMAKYKNQAAQSAQFAQQHAQSQMHAAQAYANNAPDIPATGALPPNFSASHYSELKTKIAAGEAFTPDEYLKLKSYADMLQNNAKAAGAAQVEHDFEPAGFETPAAKPAKKTKGGFKEKPKFKISGGAPPAIEKATGPNAVDDGKMLWEMKKAGKIQDDYKMWSEAKKASGKAKKAALLKNPNAQSGVDYSSANQIRNVAMRLEFDETGDVTWETTEEKTSETIGQTVGQVKKTVALHEHKPVVSASDVHTVPTQAKAKFPDHWDVNAVVGSYTNPHSFKYGDTGSIQAYGYKYTDHNKPWTQAQKSAWYNFSGSGSGNVNTFFRTGDVGLYGNLEDAKKRAKALVDAFKSDNVKPLDDWTVVTRGTNGGWEFGIGSDAVSFDQLQGMVGKVVRNKCPVSTSLRGRPAFGGKHRITYKLPPGFRGLGIYGKSAHSGENEMILPPGMAYRILEVKQGDESYGNEILVEVVDVKLPEIT